MPDGNAKFNNTNSERDSGEGQLVRVAGVAGREVQVRLRMAGQRSRSRVGLGVSFGSAIYRF